MYKKFTDNDLDRIKSALKDLTGVGFSIYDRDNPDNTLDGTSLSERQAFFVNAKLWKVVEAIVVNLYLPKLLEGKLTFKSGSNIYYLTPFLKKEEKR